MQIHIMGGDVRQRYLAAYFAAKGFEVTSSYLGEETPPHWEADALILPLPTSRDGDWLHTPLSKKRIPLEEIRAKNRSPYLFGGMLPRGFCGTDYFHGEEVTLANAVPTAEGAIALAIANTPFTLAGEEVLILGGGRIGQLLALKLGALGAGVTVGARRAETLALCRNLGAKAYCYEDLPYHRFRLIFNTVPATVLDEERLQKLPKGALLMELASAPGGFDPALAAGYGLAVLNAQGLPGKYAPETAAKIIGDYILKEMDP